MRSIVLFLMVIVLLSCDGGLAPTPIIDPGFGGTITFVHSTWPPRDSLVNLWIVASQDYPLDSITVFAGIFSNPPRIYAYPNLAQNLPFNVDTLSYAFHLPPANYKYIVVIQRFRNELNARALKVVGLYGRQDDPQQPRSLSLHDFEFINGININVNFYKLPPQPF